MKSKIWWPQKFDLVILENLKIQTWQIPCSCIVLDPTHSKGPIRSKFEIYLDYKTGRCCLWVLWFRSLRFGRPRFERPQQRNLLKSPKKSWRCPWGECVENFPWKTKVTRWNKIRWLQAHFVRAVKSDAKVIFALRIFNHASVPNILICAFLIASRSFPHDLSKLDKLLFRSTEPCLFRTHFCAQWQTNRQALKTKTCASCFEVQIAPLTQPTTRSTLEATQNVRFETKIEKEI